MKTLHYLATAVVAGFCMAACQSEQRPQKSYLSGSVDDYQGEGYLILINEDTIPSRWDTLQVGADGRFYAEVEADHNVTRILYLEYLGDNRGSINCYLKPGDTLHVDVHGAYGEVTFMGETKSQYQSTPIFSGSGKLESEYLNQPTYFDYVFTHEDGTPVGFRNYKEQIAAQQQKLREMLNGTDPSFKAEKMAEIDRLPDEWYFVYPRRIKEGVEKDADLMAYANSIDLNDTTNAVDSRFSCLADERIRFDLKISPDLYKGDNETARYLCYLRDKVSNPRVKEILSDNRISLDLAMGSNENLEHVFSLYTPLSGKSELYQENKAIYDNLVKLQPGVKATNFEMQDVNGNTVKFLDVIGQGKAVYIDFWATWCGPCCAEIPYLEKLVERFKNDNRIEFISISLDNQLEKWHAKLEKDKPEWRQYVIPDNFRSTFVKEYNINAIPRFMMFDGEGRIITINADRPSNPKIDDILKELLKK